MRVQAMESADEQQPLMMHYVNISSMLCSTMQDQVLSVSKRKPQQAAAPEAAPQLSKAEARKLEQLRRKQDAQARLAGASQYSW